VCFVDISCITFGTNGCFIGDEGVDDRLPSLGSEFEVALLDVSRLFDFFFGFPTSNSTP
jgi:hypothetical protein